MNKERRQRLRETVFRLREAKTKIEEVIEEEDEARDCIPENLQESVRYQESEECSSSLEDAVESIDEAISSIEDVV